MTVEQVGQHAAADMRRLGRRPYRQHVAQRIHRGDHRARFHRHAAAAVLPDVLAEDMRRRRKGRVGVAIAHPEGGGDVVVERRCACGAPDLAAARKSLETGSTS